MRYIFQNSYHEPPLSQIFGIYSYLFDDKISVCFMTVYIGKYMVFRYMYYFLIYWSGRQAGFFFIFIGVFCIIFSSKSIFVSVLREMFTSLKYM